MYLALPYLGNTNTASLTKFNPKMQDLYVLWAYIANKSRIEESVFFNWLSNAKNLVLTNGSNTCKNVIQLH